MDTDKVLYEVLILTDVDEFLQILPLIRVADVDVHGVQFLDGLGLSGILPAPLVIFATFVGFISGGLWGALAVTAGMFLPAFAFSLLFYERLEAVVDDSRLQHVLAGVAAGVVGLIVVTLISLARSAAEASNNIWISLGIAAASLLLLYHWKHRLVPLAVVGLGASAGLLLLR